MVVVVVVLVVVVSASPPLQEIRHPIIDRASGLARLRWPLRIVGGPRRRGSRRPFVVDHVSPRTLSRRGEMPDEVNGSAGCTLFFHLAS